MVKCCQGAYVPLRVRSCFSLLKGVATVDELLRRAAALGYPCMALTDENSLYGFWDLFESAPEQGLKPIVGSILSDEKHSLIALVENRTGYANLCQLISRKHLVDDFCLVDEVSERCDGLLLLIRNPDLASTMVKRVAKDRLWLECCRPMSQEREDVFWLTARQLELSVVATTDVFLAESDDQSVRRLLTAIRRNCLLKDVGRARADGVFHMPSPAEIDALFSDCPEAVAETVRLAERCRFVPEKIQAVFPIVDNADEKLKRLALSGALERYDDPGAEVTARLEEELSIIRDMGFSDYFMVVADVVDHARRLNTPVACRGSGANSLVAYCLGITNVDPIQYALPFARFLNRGRPDFPDFDLEFGWQCRDQVIDYVFEKYGDDHVAMVSTMVTMGPRAAFRFTAKALGFPRERISRMQRVLSTVSLEDIEDPNHECWRRIGVSHSETMSLISQARPLFYKPHHVALHPGGIVITPDSIAQRMPLERSAKGVVISQFDKNGVEKAGLVKIDLLGNRLLSAAGEAIRLIKERHGEVLDVETLKEQDAATTALLKRADTLGVGQLESPSVRRLLRQLQAGTPRDIMQTLALIRPGAASLGMKQSFIRRSRGVEIPPKSDPRITQLFDDTFGIMLFEDDAMLAACALTGCDEATGDRFRRDVRNARDDTERMELSSQFLAQCEENGVARDLAADLWIQMAKFNSYSFCRAHAASYARLAWFNSYVKAHYPLVFWIAALNNNEGLYDRWAYVEEAKRTGIRFLPPCVNRSAMLSTAEADCVRLGLALVKGLSRRAQESICAHRPFNGLDDLVSRSSVSQAEMRTLQLVGALDSLGDEDAPGAEPPEGGTTNGEMQGRTVRSTAFRRNAYAEQFRLEWDILGLSIREHPVQPFRAFLTSKGYCRSGELLHRAGQTVHLCGVPATSRAVRTEDGETMCFFTLSDEDGLFELSVSPDAFKRIKMMLTEAGNGMLCATGIPKNKFDAITVQVHDINLLSSVVGRRKGSDRSNRP